MSDEFNTLTFTLRITPKLATDLKKVATQEANTASAVARRLLTKGLSSELQSKNAGAPGRNFHHDHDDDRKR
jgi:hypothetical protein